MQGIRLVFITIWKLDASVFGVRFWSDAHVLDNKPTQSR